MSPVANVAAWELNFRLRQEWGERKNVAVTENSASGNLRQPWNISVHLIDENSTPMLNVTASFNDLEKNLRALKVSKLLTNVMPCIKFSQIIGWSMNAPVHKKTFAISTNICCHI